MSSGFFQLRVYQFAVALSDEIYESVGHWPLLARTSMGSQLIRSADSVGANIAEAVGRWSEADKRRLLLVARGSLYETERWMVAEVISALMSDQRRANASPGLTPVDAMNAKSALYCPLQ